MPVHLRSGIDETLGSLADLYISVTSPTNGRTTITSSAVDFAITELAALSSWECQSEIFGVDAST